MRKFIITITSVISAMIGYNSIANEQLVTEDGNVNAQTLLSYETATFGIG
jgi:hypothetical protein